MVVVEEGDGGRTKVEETHLRWWENDASWGVCGLFKEEGPMLSILKRPTVVSLRQRLLYRAFADADVKHVRQGASVLEPDEVPLTKFLRGHRPQSALLRVKAPSSLPLLIKAIVATGCRTGSPWESHE